MLLLTYRIITHNIPCVKVRAKGEMDYIILLLIPILTVTQTTSVRHNCNSDGYSSASGMADLQQLTTLQYCLIDNCTIIRTDTGQQLDIVYTTQISHLVVTPTDGQTSMLISKNDPELFCSTPSTSNNTNQQIPVTVTVIISVLLSGYIAVVHLMFKQLRGTFGKLLMIYNIAIALGSAISFAISITHYNITVDSIMPCYLLWFLFMQLGMVREACATCIIAFFAYIMHHSYKCREVTKEMNKNIYRHSIAYILGSLLLFDIFIVGYDFGTGSFKLVILPNGHCDFFVSSKYDTVEIVYACQTLNKTIQITLLVVYFLYYYKLNRMLRRVHDMAANADKEQNRLFLKIAVTMAVTIGLSYFVYAFNRIVTQTVVVGIIGNLSRLVQQCVIVILIMCSKNVSHLCKERFCN